jgi:hypothetical protein
VREEGTGAALVVPAAIGFVAGGITAAWLYTLYPPARDHTWPIWALSAGSILFVLMTYFTARRLGALPAGDALVIGYGLALVIAASLVVTREIAHAVGEHVPEYIGVKRVGLTRVEVAG